MGDVASRSPVFALYDDGLAIYLVSPGRPIPRYAAVMLERNERSELLASLPSEHDHLQASYSLADMPHHPINVLHVWCGGRRKTTMVYGDLGIDMDIRERCPPAFLLARDTLRHFSHPQAEPWLPKSVQVHFSEQELMNPPRQSWPASWPDLDHPQARHVPDGYVLYLDFEHVGDLATFWEHPGNSHAEVEIGGRSGLICYSIPFPCHRSWED